LYYRQKVDYCPEAPILFTEAYEALRLSDDLLKLPVAVRNRLNNTLSLIAIHNLRVSEAELDYSRVKGREEQFRPRMDGILKHLKVLENELGKGVQKATERSDYAQESLLPRYMIYYIVSINLFLFWSAFDIRVLFSRARYYCKYIHVGLSARYDKPGTGAYWYGIYSMGYYLIYSGFEL
jgi:hypothetical protein